MKVKDWMSGESLVLAADLGVSEAVERMEAAGVMHLPVVRDGVLLGLASTSTVLRYLPSAATTLARYELPALLEPLRVTRGIDHAALTLAPGDDLDRAAELMRSHGVDLLPVVEEGRFVGVVRAADLLDALRAALHAA
jgi:CBS domain-containing protein